MIAVGTMLNIGMLGEDSIPANGDMTSVKVVTVAMDPDDALALTTILFNLQGVSPEWKDTFFRFAQQLLDAANKCR